MKCRYAYYFSLLLGSCVPINQQSAPVSDDYNREDDPVCRAIITDASLYIQVIHELERDSVRHLITPDPSKPCSENPNLKLPRQSKYYKRNDSVLIEGQCLIIKVNFPGGNGMDECHRNVQLINDGFLRRDENKRLVLNMVFSFVNVDMRRAWVYKNYKFDLSSLKIPTKEKLYLRLYGEDKLLEFNPM